MRVYIEPEGNNRFETLLQSSNDQNILNDGIIMYFYDIAKRFEEEFKNAVQGFSFFIEDDSTDPKNPIIKLEFDTTLVDTLYRLYVFQGNKAWASIEKQIKTKISSTANTTNSAAKSYWERAYKLFQIAVQVLNTMIYNALEKISIKNANFISKSLKEFEQKINVGLSNIEKYIKVNNHQYYRFKDAHGIKDRGREIVYALWEFDNLQKEYKKSEEDGSFDFANFQKKIEEVMEKIMKIDELAILTINDLHNEILETINVQKKHKNFSVDIEHRKFVIAEKYHAILQENKENVKNIISNLRKSTNNLEKDKNGLLVKKINSSIEKSFVDFAIDKQDYSLLEVRSGNRLFMGGEDAVISKKSVEYNVWHYYCELLESEIEIRKKKEKIFKDVVKGLSIASGTLSTVLVFTPEPVLSKVGGGVLRGASSSLSIGLTIYSAYSFWDALQKSNFQKQEELITLAELEDKEFIAEIYETCEILTRSVGAEFALEITAAFIAEFTVGKVKQIAELRNCKKLIKTIQFLQEGENIYSSVFK